MQLLLRAKEPCFLFSLKTDDYFWNDLMHYQNFYRNSIRHCNNKASAPASLHSKYIYIYALYLSNSTWLENTQFCSRASMDQLSGTFGDPAPACPFSTSPIKDQITPSHPPPLSSIQNPMNNKIIMFSFLVCAFFPTKLCAS